MSFNKCQDLVDAYVEWINQRLRVKDIDGVCEITTPFLDRHNDQLQIYVKRVGDTLILTDDGYILGDLELGGFEITTEKRKRVLHSILNGFGACFQGDEIIAEAPTESFPQKKHDVIQAMLAMTSSPLQVTGLPASRGAQRRISTGLNSAQSVRTYGFANISPALSALRDRLCSTRGYLKALVRHSSPLQVTRSSAAYL
ncbi:MAG: DUF1828 domain-containing protein [Euryarchaeota archaeon]|nr:DUF1828 domain-containing protein [Euryarchaeota archaeon]